MDEIKYKIRKAQPVGDVRDSFVAKNCYQIKCMHNVFFFSQLNIVGHTPKLHPSSLESTKFNGTNFTKSIFPSFHIYLFDLIRF